MYISLMFCKNRSTNSLIFRFVDNFINIIHSGLSMVLRTSHIFMHRLSTVMIQKAHLVHPQKSRSEEHTSELQSHFELVCRLLLEKKKMKIKEEHTGTIGGATNRED